MIAASWVELPLTRVHYEYLGMNSLLADAPLPPDPLEVVLRVVFCSEQPETLKTAVRRVMANGLSGPAGMSVSGATVSGEPRAIVGLFPTLVPREVVKYEIDYLETE
jgi:hypothetical protein